MTDLKLSMETECCIIRAVAMSRELPYLFRVMLPQTGRKPVMVMEHAGYMEYRRQGYRTVAQIRNGVRLSEEYWEKERTA